MVSPGYERRIAVELPTSGPIYILSPAHYLCTKLSATKSRGYPDLLVSHDLEDVVYLISNCRDLIEDARTADDSVKTYIHESFQELRANPNFEEAISYSLPYGEADRLGLIQNRVDQLLALVERSA